MQTVTFANEYRHKLDELRTAIYPAGMTMSVTDAIAKAAKDAGALEEIEDEDSGE